MKIKKLNLFITSNDVSDFGKSFTIKKSYIYLLILFSLCILFFFSIGIYSFFLSSETDIDSRNIINVDSSSTNTLNNASLFSNDPVKAKQKSDAIAPTSYITTNFTEEHIGIDINGNPYGAYDGTNDADMKTLVKDIRVLMAEYKQKENQHEKK